MKNGEWRIIFRDGRQKLRQKEEVGYFRQTREKNRGGYPAHYKNRNLSFHHQRKENKGGSSTITIPAKYRSILGVCEDFGGDFRGRNYPLFSILLHIVCEWSRNKQ